MTERRYNDEEVAAIFEQASTTERMDCRPPPKERAYARGVAGHRARGGDLPEAIAHAARALDQTGRPKSRTFMGLTIGVGRTVRASTGP
jgi:hypothetical protein